MADERTPRCRPLPPTYVAQVADAAPLTSRAELLDHLETALAALPDAERMAVVAAHGYGEGPVGAAMELELDGEDADALTRNALQLLRGAMADADVDEGELFARLHAGRRTAGPAD
jgi:DNA-directed RNA polymerase specialized sigma24 family protein